MASLSKNTLNRIDRANWHAFAFASLTSAKDVTRIKRWIKDNIEGDSYVTSIKETVGTRRVTIATFVRIKDEGDAVLFKLTWGGLIA